MNIDVREVQRRVAQRQRNWADYRNSLVREGILDSHFLEVQDLQDEINPNFVANAVTLFFTDAEQLLHDLHRELTQQNVDFRRVDVYVNRLEGQSRSIGTPGLTNACMAFRHFRNTYKETNSHVYLAYLERMRQQFELAKSKIFTLFDLEQEIEAARGIIQTPRPRL